MTSRLRPNQDEHAQATATWDLRVGNSLHHHLMIVRQGGTRGAFRLSFLARKEVFVLHLRPNDVTLIYSCIWTCWTLLKHSRDLFAARLMESVLAIQWSLMGRKAKQAIPLLACIRRRGATIVQA